MKNRPVRFSSDGVFYALIYSSPLWFRVFPLFNASPKNSDGITFSDIVAETEVPKSTVFRILHTFENNSWVEKRGGSLPSRVYVYPLRAYNAFGT